MEDYKIKIGKRIETALTLSGKKQKDLAEYLGILPNTISYFCKGTRTPNTEQIIKIAQFLDVSADYLLGLSDNMTIDADIQTACKVTGLSQNTIYTLQAMKECNYFEILNKILSCEHEGDYEQLEDILNKIYMYCQEELKITSFAKALSELSNVKVCLSDDSTSSVYFRNVLIQLQNALSSFYSASSDINDEYKVSSFFNLSLKEHEIGYKKFCLQISLMELIDYLAIEYKSNDTITDSMKKIYISELKKIPNVLNKCIKQLQKEEEESNMRLQSLMDYFGFNFKLD